MPSAAPAHALLSAAHSLLRPAMHHGRDPVAIDILPIDEVTLPTEDVTDLRDVVDAINKLCDDMKTSSYEPDDWSDVNAATDSSVQDVVRDWSDPQRGSVSVEVETREVDSVSGTPETVWSYCTSRTRTPGPTSVVEEDVYVETSWSENVLSSLPAVEGDAQNVFLAEERAVNVLPEQWPDDIAQNVLPVEQCSENVTCIPEEQWSEYVDPDVLPVEQCIENVHNYIHTDQWSENIDQDVLPVEQCFENVRNYIPSDQWSENIVQNVLSPDQGSETVVQSIPAADEWNDSVSQDILPGQVEEVTSDGEPALNWETTGSELYYTASSEVSLVSDPGTERVTDDSVFLSVLERSAECVVAGHVAAMRERFESMTRTTTPCPEHGERELSPSPAPTAPPPGT